MKTKNNILTSPTFRALILLLMVGWGSSVLADDNDGSQSEKLIYETDFSDWESIDRTTADGKVVNLKTRFSDEPFSFTLTGVGVDPIGTNPNKFPYKAYMITAKYTEEYSKAIPNAVTSPLSSITRIELIQTATGSKRGLQVAVKGDGDADWVVIHNSPIGKGAGEKLMLDVNRTNCQIKFSAYCEVEGDKNKDGRKQNAYIVDLKIFGNVQARSFKDFRINFRTNPYTVVSSSSGLPDGVELTQGSYKDNQHGYSNAKITVPVSGPVRFIIGGCANNDDKATVSVNGGDLTVIDTQSPGCDTKTGYMMNATYVYNSTDPAVLTFNLGKVCPYFLAEEIYKIRTLNFIKPDGVDGKYPESIQCDKDGHAVMPEGKLFSVDGYTFEGWTDGTRDYEPGNSYTFTQDVTNISPKLRKNTLELYDVNKETTVVWPFDHTEAPAINVFPTNAQKKVAYIEPVQIYVDEDTHPVQDLPLVIDASEGRMVNTDTRVNALSGGAKGAWVSNNVKFSLRAVYGMKVTVHASDKVDVENGNTATVFGTGENDAQLVLLDDTKDSLKVKDAVVSDEGKTITFTYRGDAQSVTLLLKKANSNEEGTSGFLKDITAVYPVLPSVTCEKVISNADPKQFPYEKAENAGEFTFVLNTAESVSHKNTGSRYKVGDLLTFTAADTYYGYDFKGFKVDGTLYPSPYQHMVEDGITTIEAVYERQAMHKVVVKSSDVALGTASLSPIYENFYHETRSADDKLVQVEGWYTEETEVSVSGEAAINYMFDYWSDGTNKLTEANPYIIKVGSKDISVYAHFTLGNQGSVVFKIADGMVSGASDEFQGSYSITPEGLNNVRSFAIPSNYTFYRHQDEKGATLQYWVEEGSDGSVHYELGQHYSFKTPNETLTLVPVFKDNPASYTNRLNDVVLRYDFGSTVHEYVDPNLNNQRRKVCAQSVNIGPGEKPFWTAQGYVEVLEEGEEKSHKRDVALYCDTGKKGYIRNNNLDYWCALGPGTRFFVPSGVGAKISMLTYSPITSTTFDGAVPTLDEARTAEERAKAGSDKIYVYTHTIQGTASRVPIVIGDDYSYYQWLEVSVLKANLVNLHVQTDDKVRGVLAKVESVSGNEVVKLEDGGLSFHQGDRVRMTFNRKFGYEFDKIVDPDKTDQQGDPLAVLKMNDDGTVDMVGLDDVWTTTPVARNEDGTWGVASGEGKTVFVLSETSPTAAEQSDSLRTHYEVEFDITNHRNLEIQFKEKSTYYVTYNGGKLAQGAPPEAEWVEAGDKFTIPQNHTLYYDGNTLDHWEDRAGNRYEIGDACEAKAEDLRLYPVFLPNKFNLLGLEKETTAIWYFAKNDGAPSINYQKNKGFLVTQIKNSDNQEIDLCLVLDGTNGKFDNTNIDTPYRIQINPSSSMSFPATKGCIAQLVATERSDKYIEIEGKKLSINNTAQTAQTSCKADTSMVQVNFIDGPYSRYFSVTYKPQETAQSALETLTCDGVTYTAAQLQALMDANDGNIVFTVSPWKNDEQMPKITGKASENGYVEVSDATLLTKECVATVRTASGIVVKTYPIKFNFATPPEGNNPEFVSVTVNGTSSSSLSNEFHNVLQSGLIKVKFNRTMAATTISVPDLNIKSSATPGKELEFKYWDVPENSTIKLDFTPESGVFTDIYGKTCQQTLSLILHVVSKQNRYHHHTFDFVVGPDGTIDQAIAAANAHTKDSTHRYFIFVPDGEYQLTGNELVADLGNKLNGMTKITKPRVSLIGQSKSGVTIWNEPETGGISYSATLHLDKYREERSKDGKLVGVISDARDFYAQDFTMEDRLDYWGANAAGQPTWGVVFWDQSNRAVLKNVALKSYQDTYYSNNSSADFRSYFENCDIAGVVDFLCGDGNIWLEKCNIILRDRSGNNIVAPGQGTIQNWGYVFNNCTIKPESDNVQSLKNYNWTLARPWNHSPACTFLNTKMQILPTLVGWGKMSIDLVLRFHEYRSVNATNTLISLGSRSLTPCVPGPGSDECVLSDEDAAAYGLRNVLGGADSFEPNELCRQIDAASAVEGRDVNSETWEDDILVDDDILQWNAYEPALCYFLFKRDETTGKWVYQANTTDNSIALMNYGSGYYCVRAANQRGGLGAATKTVRYVLSDPYELDLKQTGDLTVDGVAYGWSTICLPFNARVPEEVTVYAATAHGKQTAEDKVLDYTMTLTPVNVMESEKGYIVYGPVGIHAFRPTSRQSDPEKPTILVGNPTKNPISSVNNNGYVLANKTWGLGFYKYSGSTLAPYRAWLPKDMVGENVQLGLSAGTNAIRFNFSDGSTPVQGLHYQVTTRPAAVYNLKGEQVDTPSLPGVYIIQGKGKVLKK